MGAYRAVFTDGYAWTFAATDEESAALKVRERFGEDGMVTLEGVTNVETEERNSIDLIQFRLTSESSERSGIVLAELEKQGEPVKLRIWDAGHMITISFDQLTLRRVFPCEIAPPSEKVET